MLHRSMLMAALIMAAVVMAAPARAADAARGRSLAQAHCAGCHVIAPHMRNEVADSPPFMVIARKYGFDASVIAHVIAGPHPKMNFSPRGADAADLAAYIAALPH